MAPQPIDYRLQTTDSSFMAKSSRRWVKEHEDDLYVRKAREQGWRSRAVFKLEELQNKYRLIRPGLTVVDLGASPGGWSQYAAKLMQCRGRVIAVDLLPMEPLAGVDFIQGDFLKDEALAAIEASLDGASADLVLSDMAPNISGMAAVDQPRAMYLAELALDLATRILRPGGSFICKVFHGEGFDDFVRAARKSFESVQVRKPKASRPRSREVYLVARNYRMV